VVQGSECEKAALSDSLGKEFAVGALFDTVQRLVIAGRYVVSQHAVERLDERGILEWQIVDGIEEAVLLTERPDDQPNPSVRSSRCWRMEPM
jgi:hypothetical protein